MTAGVAAASIVFDTTSAAATAAVLAVAAALGIPHGALDHRVMQARRRPADAARFQLAFHAAYVASMAAYGLVWWWRADVALGLFLVLSVHHFGQSDLARLGLPTGQALAQWSRGAFLVGLPLVTHVEAVGPLVEQLSGIDPSTWGWLTSHRVVWIALIVGQHVLVGMALHGRLGADDRHREAVTVAALGVLFVVADPLVGFAVYFGLWHSLAHLYVLRDVLEAAERRPLGLGRVAQLALPRTVVAAVAVAGAAWWWGSGDLLAPLFVALSLLTVPHLVVVEGLWRDRRRSEVEQDRGRAGAHRQPVGDLVSR